MTKVQLDKDKVMALLAEANTKWYTCQFKYRGHLEFVAEYVAPNYHKKGANYGNTRRRSS